jgi:probable phosphoglycerate mutase
VAGYGALVRDADSNAVLVELAAPLGQASNNVAEYSGLIAGLGAALEIDSGAEVTVRMDSKLVIEQMSGRWKIKHEDMRRLALEARELCSGFAEAGGSVRFEWVPREQNKAADALSNEGMDGHHVRRDHRAPVDETGPATPIGTGLQLLLVQLPGDESQVAAVAAGAGALLGPEARVTATGHPLALEVARRIAEPLGVQVAGSDEWAAPSGTGGPDERVRAAYHSLTEEGGTVVAVTTRRGVLTVLAEVLGLAPDRFWTIATAPGSLSAVEVWPDGTASVAFTNRTAHLH